MPPKPCDPNSPRRPATSSSLRCDMQIPPPLADSRDGSNGVRTARRRSDLRCWATANPEATPMQMIILGSGSPLPDPERAGPATLVRTGAGDLLFDCGRGRPHASGGRRIGGRRAARPLPHPPAQRPHHRPQRHRHVAVDHVVPAASAPRLRSRRDGVADAGDRGHAGARHRLSPLASRRPAVAAVGGRRRVRARHGAPGSGRPGHVRLPPITRPSAPPSASGRRRGPVGRHRGRHRSVPGTRRALHGGGHARAHRGATRPD